MLLIGVNRSPYTRRVAITLRHYGVTYAQRDLSGFGDRDAVRAANPLGRIPALVLDDRETLVDSGAIVDHLDQAFGGAQPLTPAGGAERRAVLRLAAIAMGACDKGLQAAYARNHYPPDMHHLPWIDDCLAQMWQALAALESAVDPASCWLLLDRLTQADICAFVAERLGRGLGLDTAAGMPRLHGLARRWLDLPAFRSTEP
ncbi:MAG: glutathione S-transferase family protein [Reyranellaceae bacterium]